MNLRLEPFESVADGIFGILYDTDNNQIAVTLQHAYDSALGDGSFVSKLQPGVYTCVRGTHKLHDGIPFETFEVTGVAGHWGVLFHVGNYNKDSEGCILLGRRVVPDDKGANMITSSKNTFLKFMDLQSGVQEFTLTVV